LVGVAVGVIVGVFVGVFVGVTVGVLVGVFVGTTTLIAPFTTERPLPTDSVSPLPELSVAPEPPDVSMMRLIVPAGQPLRLNTIAPIRSPGAAAAVNGINPLVSAEEEIHDWDVLATLTRLSMSALWLARMPPGSAIRWPAVAGGAVPAGGAQRPCRPSS